jgi:hypothetical protein
VALWWAGAALGAASSLGALIFGLYALAYAEHSVWLGGYSYGCDDQGCAAGHVGAALLCLASVAIYVVLLLVAPFTSERMLRAGERLGLAWTMIAVALGVAGGWPGLALLATAPALMGVGSRMRLRAKQRRPGGYRRWSGRTASRAG